MGVAHPLEHPLVVSAAAGADPSGEHDDVGLGELLEGGVDGDAEHAVLAADLARRWPMKVTSMKGMRCSTS